MLEINIKYEKIIKGRSSMRGRLLGMMLKGLRSWDRWRGKTSAEQAWHYSTLEMYPLGTLGRALSEVLIATEQPLLHSANMHELLLHLYFPIFSKPQMNTALPYVLLGNGKIQKRILILSSFSWLVYIDDRAYFQEAFELGKSLNKFTRWDIRHLLQEPNAVIQAMMIKESVGESEAPLW